MQVWKRRLAAVLAVTAGSAGLITSGARAQTSPGVPATLPSPGVTQPEDSASPVFPPFPTFPTIPPFPSIPPPPTMPPFTVATFPPPPTMPPLTSPPFPTFPPPPTMPPVSSPPPTSPPPTMPPSTSPPPTSPPPTIPPATTSRVDAEIQSLIDQLEQFGDRFQDAIDSLRALQDSF